MKRLARPREGDVVRIDLGDGSFGYGRILKSPAMAFYDFVSYTAEDPRLVVKRPVAFVVWVMRSALKSERWKNEGNLPLEDCLRGPFAFFNQDVLDPGRFLLIIGDVEQPAKREECHGLERAAVWSAEHVEDRLRDHFAGRPNVWFEALRLREPPE